MGGKLYRPRINQLRRSSSARGRERAREMEAIAGRLCRAERPRRALHGCCNRLANWDRRGVTWRNLMRELRAVRKNPPKTLKEIPNKKHVLSIGFAVRKID